MTYSVKTYQCFDFIDGTCSDRCLSPDFELNNDARCYCAWTGRYVRFMFLHEVISVPEPEFDEPEFDFS